MCKIYELIILVCIPIIAVVLGVYFLRLDEHQSPFPCYQRKQTLFFINGAVVNLNLV